MKQNSPHITGLTLVPSPRGEGCLEDFCEESIRYITTIIFGFCFSFLFPKNISAQKYDTLTSVKVLSVSEKNKVATTILVQTINETQLAKLNSISVADAVKNFAGVQVKDYGGIGGLKTVSVRSLGANHTGIMYDGVAINDAQGGQIDLGKFSLDNISAIELYNTSPTDILMPAKAFSYAALLVLKTYSNSNNADNNLLKLKIQQGSFGYISPSLVAKKTIGKNIQMSLSTWYQSAKNQYPYNSYEILNTTDKRNNSDIKAYKIEYDFDYKISEGNKLKFKTYCYNSNRGLPGSIILYNNTSNQRLDDNNFFTQASWQRNLKGKHFILFNTKYNYSKNYYIDPVYPNSFGKLENEFHQNEIYFSGAYKYQPIKSISIAIASDFFNSTLKRTDIFAANFADPNRNTVLNNIAVNYKKNKFELAANLLHTSITEKVTNGVSGKNLDKATPAFSASFKPIANKQFYIRAFYKNIFRVPTFNDLYYTNIGNVNLRPEFAKQLNLGVTFSKNDFAFTKRISITTDAYYNIVTDKILAVPKQNLFQWSMQNIGKVKIKGVDATLHINFADWKNLKFTTAISYTYQQALDVSDKTSNAYNTQLPYTPAHSGSVNFSVDYKNTTFSYNFIGSSLRYRQGDIIPENALNPWSSNDFSLAYNYKTDHKIILEANNIFNKQYEIIKYYPMPKFNYRITFTTKIKTTK